MPIQDFQKEYIVKQSGYNPDEYTTDEEGEYIIPKSSHGSLSPSISPEIEQSSAIKPTPDFAPEMSGLKSAAIGFRQQAVPSILGGIGAGVGMSQLNPFAHVAPPYSELISGLIGAGAGALGGQALMGAAEPEEWEKQAALAQLQHPYAFAAGNIATIPLSGFSPTTPSRLMSGISAIPKVATGMAPTEVEAANLINLGLGAALPPIQSIAMSQIQGKPMPSIGQLGEEALIGSIFSKPNIIGKNLYGFHDINPKGINDLLQGSLVPREEAPAPISNIRATPTIDPISILNQVTPTMGTWSKGEGLREIYTPYKSAKESALEIFKGGETVPREAAYEAAQKDLSQFQIDQLVRSKEYNQALAMKNEQDRQAALAAKNELDRQEIANQQSENATRALELQQGMGPKFSDIQPKPIATTELGKEIFPDYTGVGEQAKTEVAAESPADLAARQAEARLSGKGIPKYSEESELPSERLSNQLPSGELLKYKGVKKLIDETSAVPGGVDYINRVNERNYRYKELINSIKDKLRMTWQQADEFVYNHNKNGTLNEAANIVERAGGDKDSFLKGMDYDKKIREMNDAYVKWRNEIYYKQNPQNQSLTPIRTAAQEKLLPELSKYTPTKPWFDILNQHIFNKTGIKVDMSGNVTDQAGNPVAGQTLVDAFQKGIKLNVKKMGADTPVHELYHAFVELLRQSNRAGDKRILAKYDKAVEASPDYKDWASKRREAKLSDTPEEYQATNAGYEFISRHLNLDNEGAFAKWRNDFGAYLKTRFGKNASVEDIQRLMNYKLMHDKSLGDISGAGAQAAKSSEQSELQSKPSEDKQAYDALAAQMQEALKARDFDKFYELQLQTEAIKNRHGGLVPKYSESSELTPEGKFPYTHGSVKETLDEHIKALKAGKYDEDESTLPPEKIQEELASIKSLFIREVDWGKHEDIVKFIDGADFDSLPQMINLEQKLKRVSPKLYEPKATVIEAKQPEIPAPVKAEEKPAKEKQVKEKLPEQPKKYPIIDVENTWQNPEPLSGKSKEEFVAQIKNEYAAIDKLRSKEQAINIMEKIKEGLLRNVKYRADLNRTNSEVFRAESRANIMLAQYEHLKNRWKISDPDIEQMGRESFVFNWPKPKNVSEAEKTADITRLPLAKQGAPEIGMKSITEEPIWKTYGFDNPEDWQAALDKVRKQRELEKAQQTKDEAATYANTLGKYPRKVVKELLGDEAPPKPKMGLYSEESELPYKKAGFVPVLTGRIDKIADTIKTPEARYVADNLHRVAGETSRLAGQIGNRAVEAIQDLNPKQVDKIYKYLHDMDNWGKSPIRLTPDEKVIADKEIEILREPRRLQQKMGLLVSGRSGNYREAGIKPQGYMHNMLDPKVAYTWAEHRNSPEAKAYDEAYIKHQIAKGSSKTQAEEMLHEYKIALGSMVKGGDVDFGALRRPEGNGLPWDLVDKNFVSASVRYANRAARDLAFFKYIENDPKMRYLLNVKDQFGNWEPKEKWIKELGSPLGTEPTVQQAMRSVYGIDMPKNPRVMAAGRLAANIVMGPGTAARNLLNMGSFIAQYVQIPQLPKVFEAIAGMNEAKSRAFRNNAIRVQYSDYDLAGFYEGNPNPAINLMNKVSALLRKYQGRDLSDQIEGLFYYSLGEHLATANLAAAKNGNRESLRFIKRFSDTVDGGAEKLLKGKVEQEDIEKIAKRFTDAARGTYGEEGLPSFAIEGEIAPFTALSRFALEKSNTIWKDVVEPMRQGIYGPFLRYLFASLGVGIGIEQLNELLSNKRGPDATVAETLTSDDPKDYASKMISLLQLASFAGIVGDSMKLASNVAQGKSTRYNQPLSFPLYTLVTDTLAGNIGDAAKALQDGEDPFEVGIDLLNVIAKQSSQAYRYVESNVINPEETKRKEKFRDVRVFNELEDNESAASSDRAQELINISAKKFKRTGDIGEAIESLPELISKAFENADGNVEKLKRELRSLKQNNYQTMPSPDKMPVSFIRYLNFLQQTQGTEAARDRFMDYMTQNAINKEKSSMIPSL